MCSVTVALVVFLVTRILFSWWYSTYIHRKKLPPGPFPLPIIGNLHLLGNLPHRSFYKLSKKYGPIMSIKLGSINAIVVSSPDIAKIFHGTHDASFSSRPKVELSKYVYDGKGIVLAEYGDSWRNARKFCTMELLSPAKVNGFSGLRKEEIMVMVENVRVASMKHEVVDLSVLVGAVIEGMLCRMLFGKKIHETFGFKKLIDDFADMLGTFNIADYVPILAPFDLQGLIPRFKSLNKDIDIMLEAWINEREECHASGTQSSDQKSFIDILVSLKEEGSSSHDNPINTIDRSGMKAILLDLVIGGIDTSRGSIEWVLCALFKHPRVMKKLQKELRTIVGDKRVVEETDLPKLTYFHMVVKESSRLYPVGPLLMPHASTKDMVINGYHIPKDTHVYSNVWAFGRDPKVWSKNCEEFIPERFLDNDTDFRGPDFRLMHFSTGRRGCPAMNLGLLNVGLIVSNLVHSFDWVLPNGMTSTEFDMNEKFVMTMVKDKPLLAIPTTRT